MAQDSPEKGGFIIKTVVYGLLSGLLYILLYEYSEVIMEYSMRKRYYVIIPVLIAFVFSFIHGSFTSYFWEALGIRAKK